MTLNEAFCKTIELLEVYYNNHKQDDAVVSILSDLDCTVFQDGKPVDQAPYDDWEKVIIPFIIFSLNSKLFSSFILCIISNILLT